MAAERFLSAPDQRLPASSAPRSLSGSFVLRPEREAQASLARFEQLVPAHLLLDSGSPQPLLLLLLELTRSPQFGLEGESSAVEEEAATELLRLTFSEQGRCQLAESRNPLVLVGSIPEEDSEAAEGVPRLAPSGLWAVDLAASSELAKDAPTPEEACPTAAEGPEVEAEEELVEWCKHLDLGSPTLPSALP